MKVSFASLLLALAFFALVPTVFLGCGSGLTGSSPVGDGATSSSLSAQQKTDSTNGTDTTVSAVQQVQASEDSSDSGSNPLGRWAPDGRAPGDPTFTSLGNEVIEKTPPVPPANQGTMTVTGYDAHLTAGTNFTDSDGNGKVSTTAEKNSITAKKIHERKSATLFDPVARQANVTEWVRRYAHDGATVVWLAKRVFTNIMTFSGIPQPGTKPDTVETSGTEVFWKGSAAASASAVQSGGQEPDPLTADGAGRFYNKRDYLARTCLNYFAGTRKVDNKFRLFIGAMTGTTERNAVTGAVTSTQNGAGVAYERATPYNVTTEVTQGADHTFSFTPTGSDTKIFDSTISNTVSSNGDGSGRVIRITLINNLKQLKFVATVQNGVLTGTIYTTGSITDAKIADITIDKNGNGTLIFADGSVRNITNWQVAAN